MNLDFRKQIVKYLIWSVALYAEEMWAVSNTDVKSIEALELCGYEEGWKRSAGQ